jgi:hypothetical protein
LVLRHLLRPRVWPINRTAYWAAFRLIPIGRLPPNSTMVDKLTVTRDIEAAPDSGWRYTVPETGETFRAKWAKDLRAQVRQHMEANNIPIPDDFEEMVNDAACRQSGLGAPFCGKLRPKTTGDEPVCGPGAVGRFIKTVRHAVTDRKVVDRAEAERRIAICMSCPKAGYVGGCGACAGFGRLYKWAKKILKLNGFGVPEDKQHCLACCCVIELKALLFNSTLNKAEGKIRPPYWNGCWRNEK